MTWTEIFDSASAIAFADAIDDTTRAYYGATAPGSAIDFGAPLFFNNNFDAVRQVMYVSGDGQETDGSVNSVSRDDALAAGVDTINGITIGDSGGLSSWYQNNVVGGDNTFHIHASSFNASEVGVKSMLTAEIQVAQLPEPSSLAILALGIMGLVTRRFNNNFFSKIRC